MQGTNASIKPVTLLYSPHFSLGVTGEMSILRRQSTDRDTELTWFVQEQRPKHSV